MTPLTSTQMARVDAQFKKYGVDSPELREELTDHFAAVIWERMEAGASFDQAFSQFVSENSWLKLRKLHWRHLEYSQKSVKRQALYALRKAYAGPLVWLTAIVIWGLWSLSGFAPEHLQPAGLSLHIAIAGAQVSILLYVAIARLGKYSTFQTVIFISVVHLYHLIYILIIWNRLDYSFVNELGIWGRPVFVAVYALSLTAVYLAVSLLIWGLRQTVLAQRGA